MVVGATSVATVGTNGRGGGWVGAGGGGGGMAYIGPWPCWDSSGGVCGALGRGGGRWQGGNGRRVLPGNKSNN